MARKYEIDFDHADWEELVAMSFDPFEFEGGEALTRGQWHALAEMALGKAQLIDEGRYDVEWGIQRHPPEATDDDDKVWAAQLRRIARRILEEFQPADGKL